GNPGSQNGQDNQVVIIENCLVVGFVTAGIELTNNNFRSPAWTIKNCTIYGDGTDDAIRIAYGNGGTPTVSIINNAVANVANFVNQSGTGTTTYDSNATPGGS